MSNKEFVVRDRIQNKANIWFRDQLLRWNKKSRKIDPNNKIKDVKKV